MKKFICLALTIILMCALIGCSKSVADKTENSARIIEIYDDFPTTIYVDAKTGVMYLWVREGYGGDLEIMVDAAGKPLLWEGNK